MIVDWYGQHMDDGGPGEGKIQHKSLRVSHFLSMMHISILGGLFVWSMSEFPNNNYRGQPSFPILFIAKCRMLFL